jgi:hypothetical protein
VGGRELAFGVAGEARRVREEEGGGRGRRAREGEGEGREKGNQSPRRTRA